MARISGTRLQTPALPYIYAMHIMPSFWERESFSRYDHIVVGSGITGVSHAIELKEENPKARVLVLERGLLPAGASTRNAGFACMGSVSELLDDLKTLSEDDVVGLFMRRKKGLETLRARLGDDAISFRQEGAHELIAAQHLHSMDRVDYLNDLLFPHLGKLAFRAASERIADFGFSKNHVAELIENTCEGSIDTGRTMRALIAFAQAKGIEIMTGAEVRGYEEEADCIRVFVSNALHDLELTAYSLSICTNAFAPGLLADQDVVPGRGQVLITKPIPGLRFKGIFHYDEGYYYFRELDGRVLLGGGRNLDFDGEATAVFDLNARIQADLEQKLREMILPDQPFEIDMRWSGIMAFGKTKAPIIKQFSPRVFGAFRMGGMGVALGSEAARELAAMIMEVDY